MSTRALSSLLALLCLGVVVAVFALREPTDAREPLRPAPDTGESVASFEEFEARDDARCYATASRLEDSIYGTPFDEEARFAKVDLQKRIVRDLWQQASAAAGQRGAETVGARDLRPVLDALVRYELDGAGNAGVRLRDRTRTLAERDLRRHAALADAPRAILAVAQDQRLAGGGPLLPLDREATDLLGEALDVLTLAAVGEAESEARRLQERRIAPERLVAGLARVVEIPPPAEPWQPRHGQVASGETFRRIVREKTEPYSADDASERAKRASLFLGNVERFYARFHVPPGGLTLPENLGAAAEDFLARVLAEAAGSATARGEGLLRARDVGPALQHALPYTVDDLEHLSFFPRLDGGDRVVLDPFDLESFRDSGIHWRLLAAMLDGKRLTPPLEPDPFAAERLAEGVAQYSVLLLRMAGAVARERKGQFVTGDDLREAALQIERRAEANLASPQAEARAAPIASAASSGGSSEASPDASARAKDAAPFMSDVTGQAGIDFVHASSAWLSRFRRDVPLVAPTFSGGGLAAGDVNGDGWQDLLFVGGRENVLYRGLAGGFERDPLSRALQFAGRDGLPAEARQPIIADFDNDGRQDLLITFVDAPHRLLRNRGGRLEDVSATAGLGGVEAVTGPAVAFDFDRDGLLDLYLCRFGNYLAGYQPGVITSAEDFPGELPSPDRDSVNGQPNRLLRNLGGFRFEEVPDAGAADRGWCQAASHTDFDGDGLQDLVVANDFGRNRLLRNTGRDGAAGRFEDVSESLGITQSHHSRNVGVADLNADRLPDLYISNINMFTRRRHGPGPMRDDHIVESSTLYLSVARDDRLVGYEVSTAAERGNEVGWAWDGEFWDFDNDGDDDLYVANGSNEYFDHLARREVEGELRFDWNREPNLFYRNEDGLLRNASAASGADFRGNSRSAVYLDYDADGDLDLALNDFESRARFFRNDLEPGRASWLRIQLQGDPSQGSNRDAIGARILARSGDLEVWREIRGGSGYLSMEPKTQHFGLGAAERVDLEIRWPGGALQRIEGLEANRSWRVEEGRDPEPWR